MKISAKEQLISYFQRLADKACFAKFSSSDDLNFDRSSDSNAMKKDPKMGAWTERTIEDLYLALQKAKPSDFVQEPLDLIKNAAIKYAGQISRVFDSLENEESKSNFCSLLAEWDVNRHIQRYPVLTPISSKLILEEPRETLVGGAQVQVFARKGTTYLSGLVEELGNDLNIVLEFMNPVHPIAAVLEFYPDLLEGEQRRIVSAHAEEHGLNGLEKRFPDLIRNVTFGLPMEARLHLVA